MSRETYQDSSVLNGIETGNRKIALKLNKGLTFGNLHLFRGKK